MINYIKGELFRISKLSSFRILCLLIFICESLYFFVGYKFYMETGTLFMGGEIIPVFIVFMQLVAPFMLMGFVDYSFGDELKKNTVVRGIEASYTRTEIYFMKTVTVYITSLMTLFATIILAIVAHKILFPDFVIAWTNIIISIKFFGILILILSFFLALYSLFYLVIPVSRGFVYTFLYIIALYFHKIINHIFEFFHLSSWTEYIGYLPSALLEKFKIAIVIKMGLDSIHYDSTQFFDQSLLLRIIVSLGFTILCTIFGVILFQKKDFTK
ncbi:MAG: hypothetical protein Q4P25_03310 [Tissierellia bacterium]|nr:hypothetical protein [Tissierellia bacterium]